MACRAGDFYDAPKVIVEVEQLENLLSCCRACAGKTCLTSFKQGAYMHYDIQCMERVCGHTFTFDTTPKVGR